jgi:mannose-1-phosphate guanylyltransferase
VRAVVLVGGFGTRLRPLTLTRPKQMLTVGQDLMIEVVLGHLGRHGVTEAVLALGYKPDAFRAAFPDGTCAGVQLRYAVESEPLDTAGAIRFAATEAGFDRGDEPLVVVNGDVLTTLDVRDLVAFHRSRGAEGTIHLIPVEDPSAFGVVPTDDDGRVLAFIEKPPRNEAPTNLINAGTYVLEPSVLGRIDASRPVSIERETFPGMVTDGVLFAYATDDYWLDAGKPAALLQANLDAVAGRGPGAGTAAVGAGCTVDGTVTDAVVGAGSTVGSGATVRRSVLMPGARIGADAVVEGSLLGEGVVVGAAAQVVDSVLGDGFVVEDGSVLDGVKLPESA